MKKTRTLFDSIFLSVEVTTGVEVHSIHVCTQFLAWSIAESAWFVSWLVICCWKWPEFYKSWIRKMACFPFLWLFDWTKRNSKSLAHYCMFTSYVHATGLADYLNYKYQDITSYDPGPLRKGAEILSWTIHVSSIKWLFEAKTMESWSTRNHYRFITHWFPYRPWCWLPSSTTKGI